MNNYAIVVDDDPNTTSALSRIVKSQGYKVDIANCVESAKKLYTNKKPNLMIVDVMLPDGNGVELIQELQSDPTVKFVCISGHASIKIVIDAFKANAIDFLEKPFDIREIRNLLKKIATTHSSKHSTSKHTETSADDYPKLIGQSPVISEIKNTISQIAKSNASVFLTGESGVGKEVVAQLIHQYSKRPGSYVAVNCGAITTELAASELFGHEKGSFTGANNRHIGHFENANGGTILLDEITEMPVETQVHLLRVLESSKLRRVGGKDEIKIDVRVLAASNRSLEKALKEGKLREDLYFRLAEFPIDIPPLRERGQDVLLIADHILNNLNSAQSCGKNFTAEAKKELLKYTWPGNVRELKNVIHRAFLQSANDIDSKNISTQNGNELSADSAMPAVNTTGMIGKTFWEIERELIFATLEHHDGDKEQTAKTLGISLKTLYNRLHAYS